MGGGVITGPLGGGAVRADGSLGSTGAFSLR